MIVYRDGGPGDAALMSRIGKQTFVETFGHLYTPENLAAFLANHSEAKWREELGDPAFVVRLAEAPQAPPLDGEGLGWGGVSGKASEARPSPPPCPPPSRGRVFYS